MDGQIETNDTMILCGGGAKSDLWLQIFADVFDKKIARVNVDQDAASLGAAAIAARGIGIWQDYSPLDDLFFVQKLFSPIPENRDRYAVTAKLFSEWVHAMGALPGSPGSGSNFEERS
jgi:sugar (pentulose or hexulose) kinase